MTAGRAERGSGLRAWADEIELAAQGLLSGLSAHVKPYGITNAACCTGAEKFFIVTFDQPTDFAEITGVIGTIWELRAYGVGGTSLAGCGLWIPTPNQEIFPPGVYGCAQYFGGRATLTVTRSTADIKYLVFGPNYDLGPKATPEVVRYNVGPEPATIGLLAISILGLFGACGRARPSAPVSQ